MTIQVGGEGSLPIAEQLQKRKEKKEGTAHLLKFNSLCCAFLILCPDGKEKMMQNDKQNNIKKFAQNTFLSFSPELVCVRMKTDDGSGFKRHI